MFASNWRAGVRALSCVALAFAATTTFAQTATGGFGGGGAIGMGIGAVSPPAPQVYAADILWGRRASGSYSLVQMTGSFYDSRPVIQMLEPDGRITSYAHYAKSLPATSVTIDSATAQLSGGTLGGEMTWTAPADPNPVVSGGTFSVSDLRWSLAPNGTGQVFGVASGHSLDGSYNLAPTNMLLWTSASAQRLSDGGVVLDSLAITSAAQDALISSLGLNPDGLGYMSFMVHTGNYGKLSVRAVPEAATWAQFALGLLALGGLARRRRA